MKYVILLIGLALSAPVDEPRWGSYEWLQEIGQAKPGEYNDYAEQYYGIAEAIERVSREPDKPAPKRKRDTKD